MEIWRENGGNMEGKWWKYGGKMVGIERSNSNVGWNRSRLNRQIISWVDSIICVVHPFQ